MMRSSPTVASSQGKRDAGVVRNAKAGPSGPACVSRESRGEDLNPRPLGYEPSELPDCSTPHHEASVDRRSRQTQAHRSDDSTARPDAYGEALGEAVTGGDAVALGVGVGDGVVEPDPPPPAFEAANCCACWTSACACASSD